MISVEFIIVRWFVQIRSGLEDVECSFLYVLCVVWRSAKCYSKVTRIKKVTMGI